MLRLKSWAVLIALGCCLAMAGMPGSADAAVCDKSTETCTVTVTTSVWTGTPTIVCQQGIDVIRIDVSIHCGLVCSAQQTIYRCANSTQSFKVGTGDCNRRFQLAAGHTWGETVADCNLIEVYE